MHINTPPLTTSRPYAQTRKKKQDFLSKTIFLTLTIINFALPVLLFLLFLYLSTCVLGFCVLLLGVGKEGTATS